MTEQLEKNMYLLDHSEFWSIPETLPPRRLNGGPLYASSEIQNMEYEHGKGTRLTRWTCRPAYGYV